MLYEVNIENALENTISMKQTKMFQPEINREASEYMADHLIEIINQIPRMGTNISPDKCSDIFQDVYISIVEGENNGKGYDPSRDKSVAEFVYGRVKGYAKNAKYFSDFVDVHSSSSAENRAYVVAATYMGESEKDDRDMSSFQMAYQNAADVDEIDMVDTCVSVEDAIYDCKEQLEHLGINMAGLFKNIETLIEGLGKFNGNDGHPIFSELRRLSYNNPKIMDDFRIILDYRRINEDKLYELLEDMA